MGRTAPSVLWLNLEGPDGTVSRLGVTSEHPMRAYQGDWVDAGDLVVGDRIEDGNARAITVLSVELDNTPQIVHNLEVGGAHTYLVGELEAWGHNGLGAYVIKFTNGTYIGKGCPKRMAKSIKEQQKGGAGDVVSAVHHTGPTTDKESFKLEYDLMCKLKFRGKGTPGFFNRMWSPGRKY